MKRVFASEQTPPDFAAPFPVASSSSKPARSRPVESKSGRTKTHKPASYSGKEMNGNFVVVEGDGDQRVFLVQTGAKKKLRPPRAPTRACPKRVSCVKKSATFLSVSLLASNVHGSISYTRLARTPKSNDTAASQRAFPGRRAQKVVTSSTVHPRTTCIHQPGIPRCPPKRPSVDTTDTATGQSVPRHEERHTHPARTRTMLPPR